MNHIYIGDRDLDPPESDFECPGCGQQFNGYGTLSHHTARCQKALLMDGDDFDPPEPEFEGE